MTPPPLHFSVVIPTCRRPVDLVRCLDGLRSGASGKIRRFEAIVTDDGLDLPTANLVGEYPWARWTAGPRRGPAANRNHGASLATGEWLVFLDDDCVPEPGLLAAYGAAATDEATVLEGRISPLGHRSRHDEECPVNETGGHLWSCNFAIRRDLFITLGGFDDSFPLAAMEDVDLRERLRARGEVIHFVPAAGVGHAWRRRRGGSYPREYAASVARYVRKHPGSRSNFAPGPLLFALLRRLFWVIPRSVSDCGARGLGREVRLSIQATFLQWLALAEEPAVTEPAAVHVTAR